MAVSLWRRCRIEAGNEIVGEGGAGRIPRDAHQIRCVAMDVSDEGIGDTFVSVRRPWMRSGERSVKGPLNRDLADAVDRGAFREGLFYRLNVFNIEIAPLRERADDILPLCHVLRATRGNESQAASRLGLTRMQLYTRMRKYHLDETRAKL
jgi:hypothetical protein